MRRLGPAVLLGVFSLVMSGCLSRQVAADGRNFRQALLEMYNDQLMDNLIHASERQPFVQLAYKNLIVTDTQTLKANIADESDAVSGKTVVRATNALISNMRSYTNKLFFGASAELDRQMQFQADPVTGKADIYEYFIAFAHDPSLFCVSGTEPPCPVYLKKRCGSKWYWVPVDAGGVFLELAMQTTFMRGSEPPPPVYWDTTVAEVTQRYGKTGKRNPGQHVIRFSKAVPNDAGLATVSLGDGRQLHLQLLPMLTEPYAPETPGQEGKPQEQIPGPEPNSPVTRLYANDDPLIPIYYASDKPLKGGVPDALVKDRPAQVFAENNPNLVAKTKSPDAQRLDAALANYRQLRAAHP